MVRPVRLFRRVGHKGGPGISSLRCLVSPSHPQSPGVSPPPSPSHPQSPGVSPGAWWAKQISPEVHTAGRLTAAQFQAAVDAGFRSIVSLTCYRSEREVCGELAPDSAGMAALAGGDGRVDYRVALPDGYDGKGWNSVDAVYRASEVIARAPKPLLLHCNTARTATFHAAAYYTHSTPRKLDTQGFHQKAAAVGFYSGDDNLRDIISTVTGEPIEDTPPPPKPDVSVQGWNNKCWEVKPVYKNIYIAGELTSFNLHRIKDFGFDIICNASSDSSEETEVPVLMPNTRVVSINDTGDGLTFGDNSTESDKEILSPDKNILFTSNTVFTAGSAAVSFAKRRYGLGDDWAEKRKDELGLFPSYTDK